MRSEYPSGLVLRPGIGRSPVRFPARARSVWDNCLTNFGQLFHQFGDVLGCVWEWFGDVLGWIWDGFEKNIGRDWTGSKSEKFQKWPGVLFLSRAV